MEIYTIGFTKTSAADFFGRLKRADIRRLIDVRLNNVSQLAGFAKKDDLRTFWTSSVMPSMCTSRFLHLLRSYWTALKSAEDRGPSTSRVHGFHATTEDRGETNSRVFRGALGSAVQRAYGGALPPSACS